MLLEERERRRHLDGCSSRWRGALRNSSIIHIVDKIYIIRSQCRFPSHLCLYLTQSFSPDSPKIFLLTKFQKSFPLRPPATKSLHNTFSPSKRDSENKAENKQTTENSQNLHKQTNEKRKQKEEERIIFIEQKNYTNFITKKITVTLEPNKRLKAPCDGRETRISFFFFFFFFVVVVVVVFDKTTTEFCLFASTANVS